MKKYLFLVCCCILSLFGYCQEVSISEAKKVAENTIQEKIYPITGKEYLFKIKDGYTENYGGIDVFHVFNLEPVGFVIISASKAIEPVLGFSYESDFNKDNIHPAAEYLMTTYSRHIEHGILNNLMPTPEVESRWSNLSVDPGSFIPKSDVTQVAPLLFTKWDQGVFFNSHCPEDPAGVNGRAVTGCVATALGQLMNYFRHPKSGNGSYGYDHPVYGHLEVDFSQRTYNYDQMPFKPTDDNSDIAELLYNLGVSVDMDYGPQSSGMNNHKGAYTLKTYFDYDPQTEYLFKDSLPSDFDWNGTLIDHLNRKIPLYYAGWGDYEYITGHAFIFDGYSDSTHYHINWGWGGTLDGYFFIDNLRAGGSNFTLVHEVIINAVPNSEPEYCEDLKILNTFEGTIEDGSGPLENYKNNTECSWLIEPLDSVNGIKFEFLKFEISEEDYVIFFDGDSEGSPVLETFYGSDVPYLFQSNSSKVLIKFITDSDLVGDGWLLSYSAIKPVYCTGVEVFNNDTDTISDGSGNYKYQNSSFCQWSIRPDNAQNIKIRFLDFDLQPEKDQLNIYNARNGLIASLSGSEIPDPIIIQGEKATLIFTSNNSIRHDGFRLVYETNVNNNVAIFGIDEVKIYPNPANDRIFINMNNVYGKTYVRILNSDGKICLENQIEDQVSTEINVSGLNAGIYFISLINESKTGYFKFVKE